MEDLTPRTVEAIDTSKLRTDQLFELYGSMLAELRRRNIVRTANAPAGDYAEYLVAKAFGGTLAPASEKSWDVELPDGKRIQVKCRVISDPPASGQRQLSPFRSFDFDTAVIVLLSDSDYSIRHAIELPRRVVEEHSAYRQHVNGHVLRVTAGLLADPEAVDRTEMIVRAAAQ